MRRENFEGKSDGARQSMGTLYRELMRFVMLTLVAQGNHVGGVQMRHGKRHFWGSLAD